MRGGDRGVGASEEREKEAEKCIMKNPGRGGKPKAQEVDRNKKKKKKERERSKS